MRSPQVKPREVHPVPVPTTSTTTTYHAGALASPTSLVGTGSARVVPHSTVLQSPQVRSREVQAVAAAPPAGVAAAQTIRVCSVVLQGTQSMAPLVATSVPATPVGPEYRQPRALPEPGAAAAIGTPGTTTRQRRSEPPPTPVGATREVRTGRAVPASPSMEFRSPMVQYRAVTVGVSSSSAPISTAVAPAAAQVAVAPSQPSTAAASGGASPVMRMRTGTMASNGGGSGGGSPLHHATTSASTPSLLQQPLQIENSVELLSASAVNTGRSSATAMAMPTTTSTTVPPATSLVVQDPSVQRTVSMLPPTPGNTLAEFLASVAAGETEPALCSAHPSEWLDAARYWEKRRVQNSLRRLLEALQDIFDDGDTPAYRLAGMVFEELQSWAGSGGGLDEATFIHGVDAMGAWPPELNSADRCEVFAALCVPTTAACRALHAGQPLPTEVNRRMFCQGLTCLPYNVPDFPVPKHLLPGEGGGPSMREVAEQIAVAFSIWGTEQIKDFFLSGLISLEEIQAILPRLISDSLVEEAITHIIRRGSEQFTHREWHTLVVPLRMGPEMDFAASPPPEEPRSPTPQAVSPQQSPAPAPEPVAASPEPRHRQLPPPPSPASATPGSTPVQSQAQREVRSEEPVTFQAAACQRIINWSTSTSSLGREYPGHQADEGAGMRPSGQDHSPAPQPAAEVATAADRDYQALRLISIDMHNECLGPFLARAFVRCCQLYEAHCMDYLG